VPNIKVSDFDRVETPKVHGVDAKQYLEDFKPYSNLSFRLVEDFHVSNKSAHRCSFRGAIFRDSVFNNIDMTRCDFLSLKVERSKFIDCDFTTSDFRACQFGKAVFKNCNFSNGYINDCEFEEVEFIECTFEKAFITDIITKRSIFESCKISKSGFILDHFDTTVFRNMILADCTFEKHIFSECKFENCGIELEYVGTLFGIGITDLERMQLIYQGKDSSIEASITELLDLIHNEYISRGLLIPAVFFKLNYGMQTTLSTFLNLKDVIKSHINSSLVISGDDILFIENVLVHLHKQSQLPFISVLDLRQVLDKILNSDKISSVDNITNKSIKSLQFKLFSIFQEMLLELRNLEHEYNFFSLNEPLFLRLTFKKPPKTNVASFLNNITTISGIGTFIEAQSISVKEGSFIEILQCGFSALVVLRIFLFLINGVLKQVHKTIDLTEKIKSKLKKKEFKKPVTIFGFFIPKKILIPTKELANFIQTLNRDDKLFNCGIDAKNLEKIEISDKVEFEYS
jgi:uncharacterized protein YjbI with pentapeptide repeats